MPQHMLPESTALATRRYLNVGSGAHFHPGWVNVDVVPASREVMAVDVRKGLPFGDGIFDAVYCSHVLEHLDRSAAADLLAQMRRVLAPGGLIRVVVPNLEAIAREYLRLLEALRKGDPGTREADYEWMLLELFDQSVRDRSGGEMAAFLTAADLPNRDFVLGRIGAQAQQVWQSARTPARSRLVERMRTRGPGWLLAALRTRFAALLIGLIGGRNARAAYLTGVFRRSGEVHRWMYDGYSLGRALTRAGFVNVRVCAATESGIPEFASFGLDVDDEGRVLKPDSLFMEAERPAT